MRFFLFLWLLFPWHVFAAPVSLDIPAMPLGEAVRLLAEYAHINVMVSPDVHGAASLRVHQTEPLKVLASLLATHELVKSVIGDSWYVAPRATITKNLQAKAQWLLDVESAANLESQVWKIRYANAADIVKTIEGEGAAFTSERGQLRVDARTNIIFAHDTHERLAVINRLVRRLDVPVQQILIEARLVSIDQDAERQLGVDFAVKQEDGGGRDQQSSSAHVPSAGRYSVAVAHLPDGSLLDVKLVALEQQGRAELISSPTLFTGSHQEASIEAGEEVPYQEVSESGGTAVTFKKAVLGLRVTPQILPGGHVLLSLKINQDRPATRMVQGVPSISTRQIVTNVQMKSGQTIVLGGIYEVNHEQTQEGLPFLGNIPLIGLLFSHQSKREHKRELLVFVTPKIMPQAI